MSDKTPAANPVVLRKEPIAFDVWLDIVLHHGAKWAHPNLLRQLYDEGWDAGACIELCEDRSFYRPKPVEKPKREKKTYKRVEYDSQYVNSRIAHAVWKECVKLLGKNLTLAAREIAIEAKQRMEKILL